MFVYFLDVKNIMQAIAESKLCLCTSYVMLTSRECSIFIKNIFRGSLDLVHHVSLLRVNLIIHSSVVDQFNGQFAIHLILTANSTVVKMIFYRERKVLC